MWDIGGKDKIRPLWRHYYSNTHAIIMVVDSNDRDRLLGMDSWGTLEGSMFQMLSDRELMVSHIPLFILCNKQDLPNAMSFQEISQKLRLKERIKDREWHIGGCCALTGEGLYEMLDKMINAMSNPTFDRKEWAKTVANRKKNILLVSGYVRQCVKSLNSSLTVPAEITKIIHVFGQDPNEQYDEYLYYGELTLENDEDKSILQRENKSILIQFLERKENEQNYIFDDDKFIETYKEKQSDHKYAEDKWKHYDFIRMIWILFGLHGRKDGLKQIWELTPFNVTFTYFWSQLIYFGMYGNMDANICNYVQSDFEYFLVINPCFSNNFDGLIYKYYSKKLLEKVKDSEMTLPDLMPLPSIVTDIEKLRKQRDKMPQQSFGLNEHKMNDDDDDDLFIDEFEQRTFKKWEGHKSFLRVIWVYMDRADGSKDGVDKVLSEWRRFRGNDNFHLTKTYFFIHIVRYYRALYKEHNKKQTEWNFDDFLQFCQMKRKKSLQCKIMDEEWWNEYYSKSVMEEKGFNGTDASKEMVPADIKPLPQLQITSKK